MARRVVVDGDSKRIVQIRDKSRGRSLTHLSAHLGIMPHYCISQVQC